MKQCISWIVGIVLFTLLPILVEAQNPNCDPNLGPVDPTCVPIDGGLSLLIAAGIGYGVKKVRDSRKKQLAEQGL